MNVFLMIYQFGFCFAFCYCCLLEFHFETPIDSKYSSCHKHSCKDILQVFKIKFYFFKLCMCVFISSSFNWGRSEVSRNVSIFWEFSTYFEYKFWRHFLSIFWVLLLSVIEPFYLVLLIWVFHVFLSVTLAKDLC